MIYDILPVNNYRGNGNSVIFDFDFYIDNEEQLKVFLYESDGNKYELKNGADYIIEGVKCENGGYITFPIEDSKYQILTDEQKISLELDLPVSQETQYNNSSLLNLESLEYSFDYLTRLIQILKRKLSLCVKVEECSENTPQELIEKINEANINASNDAISANSSKNEAKNSAISAKNSAESASEALNMVCELKDLMYESGMYKFNLFDTKISDHILTGNEAKGWALQGTCVTKESYPDFYNKCLEQKNTGIENEVTLGSSTLTMFVNPNGHQFYNISDKSGVDTFYEKYGIADFYGIDEENERVFLPRNKYFAIKNPTSNVPVIGNGLVFGLTDGTNYGSYAANSNGNLTFHADLYGKTVGSSKSGNGSSKYVGMGFTSDPEKSGMIADTTNVIQPNESKYLYYCVGNTEVTQAITNVTEITTSENDTIPLFTGMYFDFKPNNVSWLKAGEQQNSGGIYKTCYDALVEIVNGVNNYDLKVINEADMVLGINYDEYWILDQDNLTFRTPLKAGLVSALTDKVRVLIDSKKPTRDDPDWYNLYSDGWCEQGGLNTDNSTTERIQTLLKPYKNSCYSIQVSYNSDGNLSNGAIDAYTPYTGQFRMKSWSVDSIRWETKGYVDVSEISKHADFGCLYFKVANAVQNLELLDAGKILDSLVDKLDRNNKPEIVSWGMPDYSAAVEISVSEPYTVPYDGILYLFSSWLNGASSFTIDNVSYSLASGPGTSGTVSASGFIPVNKGSVITFTRMQKGSMIPYKGVLTND